MKTQVAGSGTPPPGGNAEQRAETATGDDVHELATVADVAAPALAAMNGTPSGRPPPGRGGGPDAAAMVEDTATETAPSRPVMEGASDTSELSPFAGDSVEKFPSPESPDVYTRTIAEEEVERQEAAAPSASSLPPLPVPRTPKPALPSSALSYGAPPLPRGSSSQPPRPTSPTGAPPIPGAAAKATNRSGVVSSAPATAAVPSSAAPPKPAAPPLPQIQDVASQSGVLSSAPPMPGMAPAAPPHGDSASGRPSDVLPRPPAAGRPSDVLPRPPASAIIRPPGAAGHLASSAPGVEGPMMQSFPTPSNQAQPQNMMRSPVPPESSDPAMAAMPAAYALPGSGYLAGGGSVAATPNPPLVHTPIPPGLIGPPPDLNEGSSLGPAEGSLDQGNERARQDTPSANAVWRTAHPSAQKWAAKRHGGAVRTPKPGIIAFGLMLSLFGGYLLAIFLPTKQPLTAAMKEELSKQAGVDEHAWHFSEQLIDAANINAALFILLGVVIVLRGAMYRQLAAGHARKGFSKPALMLTFCFVLLAVSFGALLMSASA